MSANLSILSLRGDEVFWARVGIGDEQSLSDSAVRERLAAALASDDHNIVFAVPGADVRLFDLEVTREEKRHIEQALPFALEERLSEDINDLHFSRVALDDESFAVAVVAKQRMERWRDQLNAVFPNVSLDAEPPERTVTLRLAERVTWIPEQLLLPWNPGEWLVCLLGDSAMLRFGRCAGTCIERSLLDTLLVSLASEQVPDRVLIYGDDETADRAAIPDGSDYAVEWRRGGFLTAAMLRDATTPVPNLDQGQFAPSLPFARWWSLWRGIAAALVAAAMLHLVTGWVHLQRLEDANLALRAETETVYRSLNPKGVMQDPERQLRRQLDTLKGGGSAGSFLQLLEPLAQQVSSEDGAVLGSMNYSGSSGEIRVTLLAGDFNQVERIRTALVERGVRASLDNSSRSGQGVRARLRLESGQ